MVKGPETQAMILVQESKEMLEQPALSRRKFAVRALDEEGDGSEINFSYD